MPVHKHTVQYNSTILKRQAVNCALYSALFISTHLWYFAPEICSRSCKLYMNIHLPNCYLHSCTTMNIIRSVHECTQILGSPITARWYEKCMFEKCDYNWHAISLMTCRIVKLDMQSNLWTWFVLKSILYLKFKGKYSFRVFI